MTCGVPESSVLEPTLWNLFYDELLRLRLPEGVSVEGFADDVALVAVKHTSEGIESLKRVDTWIREHGLELAHSKTEAIFF